MAFFSPATPLADSNAALALLPTLESKELANEARIKQVLILYAPPKPPSQTPHHDDHPVSGLEINVGLIDGMDMGRWKQTCNPPLPGCPPLHNVTEPLDFDILLNSEPLRTWILIRKEIAEAQDTLRWCSVFKEHAKTVPHQNKAPLTHNQHRVGLKRKASAAPNIEPSMISAPRKTARMTIGRLPPRQQAITKRHRDVEKSLGEDSDK